VAIGTERSWKQFNRVITGKISGLVAIDADSSEAVAFLEANLPKTPWINVTARGRQYIYRHPGGHIRNKARLKTSSGQQDIDIRGLERTGS
jgi:Bifunctional DNA primase/polymerase, N-terminal